VYTFFEGAAAGKFDEYHPLRAPYGLPTGSLRAPYGLPTGSLRAPYGLPTGVRAHILWGASYLLNGDLGSPSLMRFPNVLRKARGSCVLKKPLGLAVVRPLESTPPWSPQSPQHPSCAEDGNLRPSLLDTLPSPSFGERCAYHPRRTPGLWKGANVLKPAYISPSCGVQVEFDDRSTPEGWKQSNA